MSDLALVLSEDGTGIDLQLTKDGSQLQRDSGLESSVLISFFTDQRVTQAELPPGDTLKRGWWGDEFLENPGDNLGSKIWTFVRGKANDHTAAAIKVRAEQSVAWMVDSGVANTVAVVATAVRGSVLIETKIERPDGKTDRFSMFWDGQEAKR